MIMPPRSQGTAEPGLDLRFLLSELVRLETELWNAVEGRLRADFSVTLPVFEFLQVISRTPACRVQDIAAELRITTGGTSKLVDRIEALGLCRRRSNPDDRRSSLLELTPAGGKLLRAARALAHQAQNRLAWANVVLCRGGIALAEGRLLTAYRICDRAERLLGDRCTGGEAFVQSFPGSEPPPTLAEVQEIQRRLTALGFNTGGADGRAGNGTMLAVQAYQRKVGVNPADGYAGIKLLARLRQEP